MHRIARFWGAGAVFTLLLAAAPPPFSEAHFQDLLRQGRTTQALAEITDYLEAAPDSVPALKLYAAILETAFENRTRAEQVLLRCTTLAPADPEVWQALGHVYLNRHMAPDAVRCFRKAVERSPSDPMLLAGLAMSYGQENDAAQAAEYFQRALDTNSRSARPLPTVYRVYAEYLLLRGRAAESVPFFDRALELDPQSADALFGRARAHEDLEQWRPAEADALAALRKSPKRLDAHMLLLRVYRVLEDEVGVRKYSALVTRLDEAEKARQAFKQRSSEALRLYLEAAEPLLREQKYEAAIPHLQRAVELWPEFPAPWFQLALCFTQTNRLAQAEGPLKKYLALRPDSADAHASLGILYVQLGRPQPARAELQRALELDPNLAEARQFLAQTEPAPSLEAVVREASLSADKKEYPQAIATLEGGLEQYPASARLQKLYVTVLRAAVSRRQRTAKLAQAAQRHPDSLVFQVGLAEALLIEDPFSPKIEPILRAVAPRLPKDPEVHYLYGRWACLNDRQDVAVRELKEALALSPENTVAQMQIYTYLAVSYDHLNQPAQADQAFRTSLDLNVRLDRPDPGPPMEYVAFLHRQQREEEAQKVVLRIMAFAPAFGPAHLERANFLSLEQKMEEALQEGELALQYAGTDPNGLRASHAFLARICAALGRLDQAQIHRQWIESH